VSIRHSKTKNNIMSHYEANLDIIKLEVIKRFDRRNKQLGEYVHIVMSISDVCEDVECIITQNEYDFIEHEYNRELRNDDLAFVKFLNNCN